jgi:hypothetical protein
VNIIASVVNIGADNKIPNLDEIDFFFSSKNKHVSEKKNNPITFDDILEVHELLDKEEYSFK